MNKIEIVKRMMDLMNYCEQSRPWEDAEKQEFYGYCKDNKFNIMDGGRYHEDVDPNPRKDHIQTKEQWEELINSDEYKREQEESRQRREDETNSKGIRDKYKEKVKKGEIQEGEFFNLRESYDERIHRKQYVEKRAAGRVGEEPILFPEISTSPPVYDNTEHGIMPITECTFTEFPNAVTVTDNRDDWPNNSMFELTFEFDDDNKVVLAKCNYVLPPKDDAD